MAKEPWFGEMANNMKVISLMISVRAKVHSSGRMAESTKVNGKMVNNMESAFLLQKTTKLKEVNGQMGRRSGGQNEDGFMMIL